MELFGKLCGKPEPDGQVHCPRCRRSLPHLEYERNRARQLREGTEGVLDGLAKVFPNTTCPHCGETISLAKLWKGQYDG